MRNWECSRDIYECIISHNTGQAYRNIWKRNFIRFFHLPGIRFPSSFIKSGCPACKLLWSVLLNAEIGAFFYCRTGLHILEIGLHLVEVLAHLCNLFIKFVKYYFIHGKAIRLSIWLPISTEFRDVWSCASVRLEFLVPSPLNMGELLYISFKMYSKKLHEF
jgi:hypothetical protein